MSLWWSRKLPRLLLRLGGSTTSRSGFGALYRYPAAQRPAAFEPPRDAQPALDKDITPVVHGSVMIRMACGNDGYAPSRCRRRSLCCHPTGRRSRLTPRRRRSPGAGQSRRHVVVARRQQRRVEQQRHVLTDTGPEFVAAASARYLKTRPLFARPRAAPPCLFCVAGLCRNVAVAYPLLVFLRIEGATDYLNDMSGEAAVGWTLGLIKGFLARDTPSLGSRPSSAIPPGRSLSSSGCM